MKRMILVILDGFGYSPVKRGNAIAGARKPTLDILDQWWPTATLQASGIAVGLPWNEQGNSEVGHLTIGSGRVVWQHLPRINQAIQDGSLFTNAAFVSAANFAKSHQSTVHLIGLISSGTVHSSWEHLQGLLRLFDSQGVAQIRVHAILDGRDAPPQEGASLIERLMRDCSIFKDAAVASLIGRTFALDREGRWDRIEKAYRLFVEGEGISVLDPVLFLEQEYQKGATDSVIEPAVVVSEGNKPKGIIQDNDVVVFFDFREDSERELARAFVDQDFKEFAARRPLLHIVTMTSYDETFPVEVAFPPITVEKSLGEIFADQGLRQLHIAETGKYAHVTYFFNGMRENPFEGEERVLIPSEREVGLEEIPAMRSADITETIFKRYDEFDFMVANYANADQVGHTGDFNATVQAIEALDAAMAPLVNHVEAKGDYLIITADHGNAELKFDLSTGQARTEHTVNPVPFYLIGQGWKLKEPRDAERLQKIRSEIVGVLTDISPTILELMGLPQPYEMKGRSILPYLRRQIR